MLVWRGSYAGGRVSSCLLACVQATTVGRVELRQLEAFVAVASELHFGRAAEKLHMGQPTLSDLVRRLEREMGTPLLTRTTRRVALTSAGAELRQRAKTILAEVAAATAVVKQWADGDVGTVRLGITPPVAAALPGHLAAVLHHEAPGIDLVMRRMWLNDLRSALVDGQVDVAMTCGPVPAQLGVVSEVVCGEPLFVGLRTDHRLTTRDEVDLVDLAGETLGMHSDALFPTWVLAQKRTLRIAGVRPPVVELADTDVSAWKWLTQSNVDWIFTTTSAAAPGVAAAIRPVAAEHTAETMLHWLPGREPDTAVRRFVRLALSAQLPAGFVRPKRQPRCMKAS